MKQQEAYCISPVNHFPWHYWQDHASKDAIALRQGLCSLNWRQLNELVFIYQQQLQQHGFDIDDTLLLPCNKEVESLLLLLAVWQIGGQVLTVNDKLPESQQQALIKEYQIDFIWVPVQAEMTLYELCNIEIKKLIKRINNGLIVNKKEQQAESLIQYKNSWQPERYATIILTSGSTGQPKGVVHRFSHHIYSALGLLEIIPFSMQDSWLLSLPLFHVSGMAILWRWLLRGATLQLILSDWKYDLDQITHASLVPTQLQQYLTYLKSQNKAPNVQHLLLGGASIPIALTKWASQYHINCWCGYGMTEMASTVTLKKADGNDSVGTVLPYRQLQIIEDQIYVAGATLAAGYRQGRLVKPFLNVADDSSALSIKMFATKDVGYWVNNELIIKGRIDHCFISGGENVYPEQIENILLKHPLIHQAIVISKADPLYGACAVAFIVLEKQAKSDLVDQITPNTDVIDELQHWMILHALPHQRPKQYLYLPTQLVQVGLKISRAALADYLRNL